MSVYYNEHDSYAAAWLRNLIEAGHIAQGEVDERSIEDVNPNDLRGFTQCHFFAGIGVWSHALRTAGWPDDRPIWTGSCPCQPFSAAGKGAGFADERHLWPAFFHLIEQCKPPVVMGEQVASKDGLAWLDLVLADLEGARYAAGAVDTCAAGFGTPHIRQRLYWVADSHGWKREGIAELRGDERDRKDAGWSESGSSASAYRQDGGLADSMHPGRPEGWPGTGNGSASGRCGFGGVADAESGRWSRQRLRTGAGLPQDGTSQNGVADSPGPTNGYWRDADWLGCRDGKWRPVEPGTFPLAHGAAARVGRLRAYGNAIVAPQAVEVIRAFMECRP